MSGRNRVKPLRQTTALVCGFVILAQQRIRDHAADEGEQNEGDELPALRGHSCMMEGCVGKSPATKAPAGATDNSPAIHRWVCWSGDAQCRRHGRICT